jgi:hypothetical protein
MLRTCLASAVISLGASLAQAQSVDSAELARQLTTIAVAQHLDAIAAPDPSAPDRFVAALLFPNAQLLVVSARYPAPALITQEIAARQYRDAYLELQQGGTTDGKLFFQDMGADGLHLDGSTVDVLYENGASQVIFDRAHRPRGVSESAFQQKFATADAQYARLLTMLVGQLKQAQIAAK